MSHLLRQLHSPVLERLGQLLQQLEAVLEQNRGPGEAPSHVQASSVLHATGAVCLELARLLATLQSTDVGRDGMMVCVDPYLDPKLDSEGGGIGAGIALGHSAYISPMGTQPTSTDRRQEQDVAGRAATASSRRPAGAHDGSAEMLGEEGPGVVTALGSALLEPQEMIQMLEARLRQQMQASMPSSQSNGGLGNSARETLPEVLNRIPPLIQDPRAVGTSERPAGNRADAHPPTSQAEASTHCGMLMSHPLEHSTPPTGQCPLAADGRETWDNIVGIAPLAVGDLYAINVG
eukprot:gene866-1359_t